MTIADYDDVIEVFAKRASVVEPPNGEFAAKVMLELLQARSNLISQGAFQRVPPKTNP